MARLVDTNILVYRHDPRDPVKQEIATELLRSGLVAGELLLPHQSILEFVAAVIRPRPDMGGEPLLPRELALRAAEDWARQFHVLYPDQHVLMCALRGVSTYQLSWFDAHLWAYAEVGGISEILSEDFEHGRHYGSVRVVNPFLASSGEVRELPAMYTTQSAGRGQR